MFFSSFRFFSCFAADWEVDTRQGPPWHESVFTCEAQVASACWVCCWLGCCGLLVWVLLAAWPLAALGWVAACPGFCWLRAALVLCGCGLPCGWVLLAALVLSCCLLLGCCPAASAAWVLLAACGLAAAHTSSLVLAAVSTSCGPACPQKLQAVCTHGSAGLTVTMVSIRTECPNGSKMHFRA